MPGARKNHDDLEEQLRDLIALSLEGAKSLGSWDRLEDAEIVVRKAVDFERDRRATAGENVSALRFAQLFPEALADSSEEVARAIAAAWSGAIQPEPSSGLVDLPAAVDYCVRRAFRVFGLQGDK